MKYPNDTTKNFIREDNMTHFPKRTILFVIILLLSLVNNALSLEKPTHEFINKYIAQGTINGFSLNDYLKNQLGFNDGVKEVFTFGESKKVLEWIGEGGIKEDEE